MKVLGSVSVLVILALGVGALPARDEVPVDTTEVTKIYQRLPDKWAELYNEERLWVLEAIEREVGSPVGSIFIMLGTPDSPYRFSKNETHLFDSYGLMFPGSQLPYVLLTPSVSSDPNGLPPPFQSPPLNNLPIRRNFVEATSDGTPHNGVTAPTPNNAPEQRIPSFVYYNGVPILMPKAMGKINIKMDAIRRMIEHHEIDA